jgi:DNA polymerase-3 subunit gamma/tau
MLTKAAASRSLADYEESGVAMLALVEYQALYRKYRPQRFSEIIGQGHVTETLTREIIEDKVAHAYLFAGPRGTGKTTAARILAKSLNCTNRHDDGEPCNECSSCAAITEGSSLDVIELDAASHNSVDDIRDMRVSVSTVASAGGAKRIFILDEAHMLSKAAGNALLKTLEEPPAHVHFVLATTEPYKLLDTIRSRAQRFDFHSVSIGTLVKHLEAISRLENYQTVEEALVAVGRHARGSVRDAMSLLEQVAALGASTVEVAGVNRALGLADREVYGRLGAAVADLDARSALEMVASLAAEGADLRRFVAEAIGFFRGVFLVKYAPNLPEVVDEPEDVIADWRRIADELSASDVLRVLDIMSETLIQLREGREERLMIELALLKITRPEVASDPASLASRIEHLEQRMKRMSAGAAIAPQVKTPAPVAEPVAVVREEPAPLPAAPVESEPAPAEEPQPGKEPAEEPAEEKDAVPPPVSEGTEITFLDLQSSWPALVAGVRDILGSRRYALFRESSPGAVEGSVLVMHLPEHRSFHLQQLKSDGAVSALVAVKASELLGAEVTVEFRAAVEPQLADVVGLPEIPDKDDLAEAPADGTDPTSLVTELFGAEVVEEVENE